MTCAQIRDENLCDQYLQHQLEVTLKEEFGRHILACRDCTRLLRFHLYLAFQAGHCHESLTEKGTQVGQSVDDT